ERTRHGMVELARQTQAGQADPRAKVVVAERAAKAYCIRPSTNIAELAEVLALAKGTVESTNRNNLPWEEMALGLAAYRNGDYAAAEQTLQIVEKGMAGKRNEAQYTAKLYRSMSLLRLERAEEARGLFSEAEAHMPKPPTNESAPVAGQRVENQ